MLRIEMTAKTQVVWRISFRFDDMKRREWDRQSIHSCAFVCVWVLYCIACLASMPQVSPHAGHSRHSRPLVGLHHGNTNHTLFTPLYEAGKHGNQRQNVCVCVWERERQWETEGKISVRVEEPKFVVAVSTHTETETRIKTHIHTQKSRLPSLSWVLWNSRASVATVLPCRVSLGLAVEATRVSIIVAAPNPVKTH